jgi:4-diphosphocytidyl-2-C-methyl-D-erythritol kinase
MEIRIRAHAKLNVSLRVLGREESGYHSVETVLLRLDLADELILQPIGPGISLEVRGDTSIPAGESNLCWRAADAFATRGRLAPDVTIELIKRIPAGAGLGGGSADAAAVLQGLNRMADQPLNAEALAQIGGGLGSDVPFGLGASPMALAWGRGDRLVPLDPPPSRPILILVPDFPIGAAEAYGWLAEDRAAGSSYLPPAGFVPPTRAVSDWKSLRALAHNDLEEPVFRRHPELRGLKGRLLDEGAEIALLCGSGSCVAGVFAVAATRDAAAEALAHQADVRIIRTRTLAGTAGPA